MAASQKKIDPLRGERIKVRVHRSNVDPDNKDLPIKVNDLGMPPKEGKRMFAPGQIVELTRSQISILRDSVEETTIELPDGSGIYNAANPLKLAEDHFPGYTAQQSPTTGQILLTRRTPNYIIEPVDDPGAAPGDNETQEAA